MSYTELTVWTRGIIMDKEGRDIVNSISASARQEGKYAQAMENYVDNPDRTNCPTRKYCRVSDSVLENELTYENEHPNIVVLVEGTMVKGWDYMRGMPPGGTLVINTHYTPDYMIRFVPGAERLAQLVCVDAAKLADHKWLYYRLGQLGLDRLSTEGAAERNKDIAPDIAAPLIAAVVKATGVVKRETIQPMIANKKAFEMALNELHILPLNQWPRRKDHMSTKGTRIPDWLTVPFAGITPAPTQEKGQDLFPTGNWRSIRPVYRDKLPPCNNACGTNEKIQGYLDLVKRGKYLDAYALIKEDMPFPSVTGRVCYHPCEQACNRGQYDEAISIRAVERFLGDLGQALPRDVVKPGKPNGKTVAVVGSGPAGHSAAYQLARLGYKVTILEKSPKAGGLNRGGIPDWVLPQHVLDREIERLVELGVTIKTNVEAGKDITWDDLKKNYDACVLAVGLTEPNSVRAEGENKDGVIYGLPFLRDIGMGTSKVKLGSRVAVIGGGNTAIDCAREALRQGAVEVTMITVESNPQEMPCVPEDLHDMVEEGVELLHGRAMTAAIGNGKVEALHLYPARFSGAINASPITVNKEAPVVRFAVDNVIIAIGQRAALGWLPPEFKNERGTIKIDRFGRLGDTNFFAAGDVVQLGSGQPLMVVNAVGDGKRVAFNLDKALRGEPLQPRKIPVDVIMDLNRMNMTYFPHFPRVKQSMLNPTSRRKTQEEVIQSFTEEQAIEEASRCFSCGTCNACDNCYLVCPEPCIVRSARSNGLYKILVDYCKGCRVCIEECPTGCLEGVPELDFDTGVVRMDTAFAISPGLHGRQAQELVNLASRPAKEI